MASLGLAFLLSVILARLVMAAGILDHPNGRSSHAAPTPRGGGLGAVAAIGVAWCFLPQATPGDGAALAGIVLIGAGAAGLGLLDDLFTLSERLKFAVLSALSLALAVMAGPVVDIGLPLPVWLGVLGSALWVFTLANAINFMDGSDGLLAACLIPACLVLGFMLEGSAGLAAGSVAAAVAGFAVWNAPLLRARGRLFCGDAGSLGLAVILAGLSLLAASRGAASEAWLMPLLVLPLLGDVLLTMAVRVRARRSPFRAHRAHAYQLMIQLGHSHRRVAMIWGGMSVVCGVLALVGAQLPGGLKIALFALSVCAFAVVHHRIRRRAAAAGLDIYQ